MWQQVSSSTVKQVRHYEGDLMVQFNSGATYRYFNVPASVHAEMMAADSKGRFLNEHVKGIYTFDKLTEESSDAVMAE